MNLSEDEVKQRVVSLSEEGLSHRAIEAITGIPRSTVGDFISKRTYKEWWEQQDCLPSVESSVRMLFLDIETRQLTLEGFGLFNQNFSLDQIAEDWSILSFSAKWYDEEEVMYYDVTEMTEDDLLSILHNLFDEAHFIVAHNGRRFDLKKIRSRMIARGLPPHSPVRVIDTLEIAKREFSFTSNKLEYLTKLLCKRHQKSSHNKFPGFLLWREFVRGNPEAIQEMREYNIVDVTSLQELYEVLAPWSNSLPNFDVYTDDVLDMNDWEETGFVYTNLGKYTQYRNKVTGRYKRGRVNLLSKEKRASLLANIV